MHLELDWDQTLKTEWARQGSLVCCSPWGSWLRLKNKKTYENFRRLKPSIPKLSFAHPFSLVQLLSHVQLFGTPWTAACQASLSITNHHNYINRFIWKLENDNFKDHLVIFIAENGLLTASWQILSTSAYSIAIEKEILQNQCIRHNHPVIYA